MTLANTSNAMLVLPSGEVYFDRFLPGTMTGEGEAYVGNTPGFSISRNVEELKRVTSYGGKLFEIAAVTTQENAKAKLKTDNMSPDNFALWFGASDYVEEQSPAYAIEESIVVKRGRWYQLGASVHPSGVVYIPTDLLQFRVGSTVIQSDVNLDLDLNTGRFYVKPDAANITDGQTLIVRFQWRNTERTSIKPSTDEVVGAMRFVSRNAYGPQMSYYFPYVRLKANSELDMKVQDFLSLEFDVDIRKKTPSVELYYITQYGEAGLTLDETAIIEDGGITLSVFPYYEDVLDDITNIDLPLATLGSN